MHDEEFLQQMKGKVEAELERVQKKIAKLTEPEAGFDNAQWDDVANDAIEDVEQESLLRIYRGLEEKVQAALTKIEDGTYGACPQCDKEIPKEFLEKEPWAELCGAVCKRDDLGTKTTE